MNKNNLKRTELKGSSRNENSSDVMTMEQVGLLLRIK